MIFRQEARDEAVDAAKYIAERASLETAEAWYNGLEQALNGLAEMPRRCPFARENDAFPDIELRQLVYKSHRLIFAVIENEVHILHVRHMARRNIRRL